MKKITAYKRAGKFGDEYLIPLKCLELLHKKETEKAYCCGEYTGYTYKDGNPQVHIFGYVPKSMLVKIGEEFFVPTWIIDKWNYTHLQFTKWIIEDSWKKEKWNIVEMDTLKDKYVTRLADACKDGFRCCLIDKEDELEVQKLFFNEKHYYFTEQEDELWLNWE